jgi:hypothetical protein
MFLKTTVAVFLFLSGCYFPINNDGSIPITGIEISKSIITTTTTVMIDTGIAVNNAYDRWEIEKKKDLGYGHGAECPAVGSCDIDEDVWLNHYPTLNEYVNAYFEVGDRDWALRVAFCESSGEPRDRFNEEVNDKSGATGWFQHLPKFWMERSYKAGFMGFAINHPEANVGVASWLFYEDGGSKHWNSSKSCWQILGD